MTPVLMAIALAAAAAPPAASASSERTVTKAAVYLSKGPSFLAPRASSVPLYRNEKVKLEGEPKGSWLFVSHKPRKGAKQAGYIHVSYLSDRPVAFKVDNKEIQGHGQVSGNYNLAVPGFKPEVARAREKSNASAAAGYRIIEKYLPLDPAKAAKNAVASPPDPKAMVAFVSAGRLREPVPEAEPAEGSATPAGESTR
jgi:hypothetical protein